MLVSARMRGVSLIQLMVTVGAAGAMASIALPWYGDNVRRTRAAEGASLAAPVRLKVHTEALGIENVQYRSPLYSPPVSPNGTPMVEWTYESRQPTEAVSSVIRSGNTVIVNFSNKMAGSRGELYSLIWVGQTTGAGMKWECLADAAASAALSELGNGGAPVQNPLPAKWAPGGCRTT